MKTITQTQQIQDYLINGNRITALDALKKFQCFRLSARILDLKKQGLPIRSKFIDLPSAKKVKEYFI
jgi:hypothetical protein